jgi:hypothetical protein
MVEVETALVGVVEEARSPGNGVEGQNHQKMIEAKSHGRRSQGMILQPHSVTVFANPPSAS